MMRILLVEPPEQTPPRAPLYPCVLPRGLLITSSVLRSLGHDARVADLRCLNAAPGRLASLCGRFTPDVVGISIHGVPNVLPGLSCVEECRSRWPEARFLVGGAIVKAAGAVIRKCLPDGVGLFDNDSDMAPARLAAMIEGNVGRNMAFVQPLGGKQRKLPLVPDIDYDALLSPTADPLSPYAQLGFEPHVETQRGCPYGCRYCGTFPRGSGNTLYREPHEAVAEMLRLDRRLRSSNVPYSTFWISDETFTSNKDHASAFCEELLRSGRRFHWRAQTRTDLVDPKVLGLMARAGCTEISFGIESLSSTVLERVAKGVDVNTSLKSLRMAREAGLTVRAILIVGLPGDSLESVRSTFELLRGFGPDSIQVYVYHPVPGSPEFGVQLKHSRSASATVTLPLDHRGFLDAPQNATGALESVDACRWFLAANQVFPGRFNPTGDPVQLGRIVQGCRPMLNGLADRAPSLAKPLRLAILEVLIASTGEFTRPEIIERASRVSRLSCAEVEALLWPTDADPVSASRPQSSTGEGAEPWRPRLSDGYVLVRTSDGGLICHAFGPRPLPDDLLRRTYTLRRDAYEVLLRCNGCYAVHEIVDAVRVVLDAPSLTPESILGSLTVFQDMGFLPRDKECCHAQSDCG